MRVLVCGGRDFGKLLREQNFIHSTLDALDARSGPLTIIHGAAKGADSCAAAWAKRRGRRDIPYPANWDDVRAPGAVIRYTRAGKPYNVLAGFQRNQEMLEDGLPDLVVAFPGGGGTEDMVERADAAGVLVQRIDYDFTEGHY